MLNNLQVGPCGLKSTVGGCFSGATIRNALVDCGLPNAEGGYESCGRCCRLVAVPTSKAHCTACQVSTSIFVVQSPSEKTLSKKEVANNYFPHEQRGNSKLIILFYSDCECISKVVFKKKGGKIQDKEKVLPLCEGGKEFRFVLFVWHQQIVFHSFFHVAAGGDTGR